MFNLNIFDELNRISKYHYHLNHFSKQIFICLNNIIRKKIFLTKCTDF